MVPENLNSVLLHLECERRLDGYSVPTNSIPVDAWDGIFNKLWTLRDTSDFDMTRIIHLLYDYGDHPAIPPALWAKLRKVVLDFKYWYTDPTPTRTKDNGEPVVDNMWYWSENHILIFRTCEYLAGQMFPKETFTVSGLTGKAHRQRAEKEILHWLDERANWGFTEWHSDVYYNWDMQPLMALIEYAGDRTLVHRAAMVLDLVFLDVALHLHKGNMGSTHGRSYIKDKPTALRQDVFDGAKLLFDDTGYPYQSAASSNGAMLARSKRYVLPHVIRQIARDTTPMEDRQRMNLPIPEEPPASANAPIPEAPADLRYNDESLLPFWWSMNAMTTWPLIAMTYEVADRENLWEAQFSPLSIVRQLFGPFEDEASFREKLFPVYQEFWPVITEPLLEEVNTYTYRTPYYMLSAAQSYRPGNRSSQSHIWQATLDETAVVFATHPGNRPATGTTTVDWQDEDEPGPGYWTGQASLPRTAAHKNVAISIYAPQYAPKPLGLDQFDYRNETHAYFPVAHFDAVTQSGHWMMGRKSDAYVALYSYAPVTWRTDSPDVFENDGLPFDLVATDTTSNLWLVELGDAETYTSFNAFQEAVTGATLTVTPRGDVDGDDFDDGFDIEYMSPSLGKVSFGWARNLEVAGETVPLRDYPRMQNKYSGSIAFEARRYELRFNDAHLTLDFDQDIREFSEAP